MKKYIKLIRISLFSILLLMFMSYMIVEYVDNVKIRTIIFIIILIVESILLVILLKKDKCAIPRIMILDFINMALFIGLLISFGKGLLAINRLQNIFQGNNGYLSSYSKSIGDEGYADIESAVKDALEYRKQELGRGELEEIYRIQVGEKVFVYLKEAESVVELEFFWQDNLYYYLGSKTLIYAGMGSSDGYTLEETIRKDIANTMWRGVGYEEVGAPTWGVSDNEQIFAMTINSEKMDNVVQIDEKSGKTYYFWIIINIGEIKTIDDVKEIKIETNMSERELKSA